MSTLKELQVEIVYKHLRTKQGAHVGSKSENLVRECKFCNCTGIVFSNELLRITFVRIKEKRL